jgi:hypothetical protein
LSQPPDRKTAAEATQAHTDVAALSAGVIAVAVTTIFAPGPYGGFGTIMVVTLLILIISYSWSGTRTLAHSMAFSAVIALIGMEVVGFFIELWNSPHPIDLIQGSDYGGSKRIAWLKAALETCLEGKPLPNSACPGTYFETEYELERLALDDRSRVNGAYLLISWFVLAGFALAVDRGRFFPGSWWPNSLTAHRSRMENTAR